jgi:outer membrane protein assembly factor BamB
LSLVWKFTTAPSERRVPPVVTADRVFVAAARTMYCLDLATGAALWQYDAGDDILAAPTYADGRLVLGADNGRLICLDATNGKELWRVATALAIRAAPTVVGDVVYAASLDRQVMAIDAATGVKRWSSSASDEVWGAPAVADNLVLVPTADGQIFGFDVSDGRTRLQVSMPNRRALMNPIAVSGDMMYIAGRSDLRALNRRGSQRWDLEYTAFLTGGAAVAGGRVFITLIDGRLLALDPQRGRPLWEFNFNADMTSPPTVVGDVVIAGESGGLVYALDVATGAPRWVYPAAPPGLVTGVEATYDVVASPVWANGSLYLIWDDGSLARFDVNAPDVSPPKIELLTPAENMLTGTSLPKVIGAQVFDEGSGVDFSSPMMTIDGGPVTGKLDPYTGHLTYTITAKSPLAPLKEGWHTVRVTVRDQRGNEATRTWRFYAKTGAEKMQTQPTTSSAPSTGVIPPAPPPAGPPLY